MGKNIRLKSDYCVRAMKIKAMITIVLLISAALMAAKVSPGINNDQFREGKYIHLDRMEITLIKTDARISIEYHLSPFAQAYVFLFGSKHLEPQIKEIFYDFKNVEVQKIGRASASIHVKDISRLSDGYYLHESRKLGISPDVLTVIYPEGVRRNTEHAEATPNTFLLV
ncbi:MAG: hypothetical protein PHG79_01085 [Methanosarcina sp.]|jgi:hypothetical protein|nr:hypothetical protein [Methanosarcina sp.]MDD4522040.1 hypothetical protein [Methanosarcina sp.]